MLRLAGRRACALGVVLALLSAVAANGPSAVGRCHHCPSGCPMHAARRIGCHHGTGHRCHEAAGVGMRNSCGRRADPAVPAPALRGVMPLTVAAAPAFTPSIFLRAPLAVATAPPTEPPTDPPRVPVVLS